VRASSAFYSLVACSICLTSSARCSERDCGASYWSLSPRPIDAGYSGSELQTRELQTAAHKLGVEVEPARIRRSEDIAPSFEALKSQKVDALYVVENSLTMANGRQIAASALSARLPTAFGARDQVQADGLMSYGPKYADLFRRAAEIVDKILRGAKPADIPVEEPTNFELIVNLKTAKALGLAVPPALLATADEVIE
jgi:putative ABC transport system substrate-binding protein